MEINRLGPFTLGSRVDFRAREAARGIDDQTLALAARFDAAARHVVGSFLLWDLDDPSGARPYLKARPSEEIPRRAANWL